MARDLDRRLKSEANRARDLLRPLAYAEGQGLPWEDLWPTVASGIAGRLYTDDDLLWLKQEAGSYVVEAIEDGRSVYRLYHAALAEHLRRGHDDADVHRVFADVLLRRVPVNLEGRRDWSRAHPYTLRHLARHALPAGCLDSILEDAGFLVHVDADRLLPLLHLVSTDRARHLRAVYRRSISVHRRETSVARSQLLAVDAAREQDHELARELTASLGYTPRCATGERASTALREVLSGHTGAVRSVATTMLNGVPIAVTGGDDGTVRTWDLGHGRQRGILGSHPAAVLAVACTTDKNVPVAISGADDGVIRVWDLTTGTERGVLTGHAGRIVSLACTIQQGDPLVVSGGEDGTVRVWDLTRGRQLGAFAGHRAGVRSVACTVVEGGPVAVTTGADGAVRTWRIDTFGDPLEQSRIPESGPTTADASACARIHGFPVAAVGGHGHLYIWDLAIGAIARVISTGNVGAISAMCWTTHDHKPAIVTANGDETVRVWDLDSGSERTILSGHSGPVLAVACSTVEGTPVVVTGGTDEVVRVWELPRTSEQDVASEDSGGVDALACVQTSSGTVVVTTGNYNALLVRETTQGSTTQAILTRTTEHLSVVGCVAGPGGPLAVTAGAQRVRVWDLDRGAATCIALTQQVGRVQAVACCRVLDSAVMVTAGGGGLAVWDLTARRRRGILARDSTGIQTIECTVLDGLPVAITTDRAGLQLWDLVNIRGLGRIEFEGHAQTDFIACAATTRSTFAVTLDRRASCRVWNLGTASLHGELQIPPGSVHGVVCTTTAADIPIALTVGRRYVEVWDLLHGRSINRWATSVATQCATFGPREEIVVGTSRGMIILDPENATRGWRRG